MKKRYTPRKEVFFPSTLYICHVEYKLRINQVYSVQYCCCCSHLCGFTKKKLISKLAIIFFVIKQLVIISKNDVIIISFAWITAIFPILVISSRHFPIVIIYEKTCFVHEAEKKRTEIERDVLSPVRK